MRLILTRDRPIYSAMGTVFGLPMGSQLDHYAKNCKSENDEEMSKDRKRRKNISNLLIGGYPYNFHGPESVATCNRVDW